MSARDEAVDMIRRICPPHLSRDEYGQILAEKFDAHRAEVLAEVGEAWPGELDHLRSLARTLTTVADAGDLTAVQRQLAAHQRIDTRRRTEQYAANGGGR